MIEINLVPTQQRKRKKSQPGKPPTALAQETWILALAGFALIMAVIIVILQGLVFAQLVRQKGYEKQMAGLMSQKVTVDRVIEQIKQAKARLTSLEKVAGTNEILWSPKLNEISDKLPRGIWLNRLSLQDGTLLLNGSAVAVNPGDMAGVHSFTSTLKTSPVFSQEFKTVEIELIKSRDISGTTVSDFTIRADLKGKGKK